MDSRIKRKKIKVKRAAAAAAAIPQETTVPKIVVEDFRAVSGGGAGRSQVAQKMPGNLRLPGAFF